MLKLQTNENEYLEIRTDCTEIRVDEFICFRKFSEEMAQKVSNGETGHNEMLKCVREFHPEIDDNFDFELPEDIDRNLFEELFIIDLSTGSLSIERLYVHYVNMFKMFWLHECYGAVTLDKFKESQSEDFNTVLAAIRLSDNVNEIQKYGLYLSQLLKNWEVDSRKLAFQINRIEFGIDLGKLEKYTGAKAFTVGEVAEVNYYKSIELDNDSSGQIELRKSLSVIAILARKKNEKLPSNEFKLRKLMDKRIRQLEGMSVYHYFLITFFLTTHMQRLLESQITKSILKESKTTKRSPKE